MNVKVKIMGIINITDDSFYAGSRAMTLEKIKEKLTAMVLERADIIDFGACSTRPGSIPVEEKEEWRRLETAITVLKREFETVPFSVDTFRESIVRKCYENFGYFTVNDISAGEDDPKMLSTAGRLGLGYIAMHKRGSPATMQSLCQYNDVTEDIIKYFKNFEKKAKDAGIEDWIIDPGFGFAKTLEQNYELLYNLHRFKVLGRKILVGISRKSFIYKKLGITPEEALPATTELHKIAIANGADMLRVHDVRAAVDLRNNFVMK